jgi:CheY-like chemotaxis protein
VDKLAALTRDEFEHCLRDCLGHLYDPDFLRSSPLAGLMNVGQRADTPTVLRRILIQAIEDLEPPPDVPLGSREWRIYNALLYLYVQQMSQYEAADKMALSARQVRRDRSAGVRALADLLWERHGLEGRQASSSASEAPPTVSQELAWLQQRVAGTSSDLRQVLEGVLELARSLATRQRTRLEVLVPADLPRIAAPAEALRQILLGVLNAGMHDAADGTVSLVARSAGDLVEARVARVSASPSHATDRLEAVRQLVELCQGTIALSDTQDGWAALVTLPASDRIPVLVIDDNADTLQLLQRYAANTHYELITTSDPAAGIELAQERLPRIIVLDVMMPQADGWEVLGELQRSAATAQTPVVICTILADAELALSLGAAAFVQKPVTQEAFLAALERAAEQSSSVLD